MISRKWSSFWTITASIAGIIGAAAAVYSLLTANPELAYLAHEAGYDEVRIEAFSEPVILTGNWYIRRGGWWWFRTLRNDDIVEMGPAPKPPFVGGAPRGYAVTDHGNAFVETRIQPNGRWRLRIHEDVVAKWAGEPLRLCGPDEGNFELGVEIRSSKAGLSWVRGNLGLCPI